MDDQENRPWPDRTHRNPALVLVHGCGKCRIGLRDSPWIVENQSGGFKTNIMFAKVLAAFALIPFESHDGSSVKKSND